MAGLALSLSLALALGCGEPVSDTEIHSALLAAPLDDVHIAACGPIRDDALRGDCQLYAAQIMGRDASYGAYCEQVDEGVWRDECFFLAAEHDRRTGVDPHETAKTCARSGRFADDCGQHLWQTGLKRTVDQNLGDLPRAFGKTGELYCYWDPYLGGATDFRQRFWQKGFGGWFERRDLLDPAVCGELDAVAQRHCEAAATGLYLRRLHMLGAHDPQALCALESPTVEALSGHPNMAAEPFEGFQEVLDLQHAWACEQGKGGLAPEADAILTVEEPVPFECI
ncbi:MAG: hypothetical protein GY913_13900 [Proteobacteria bacterium]|nr:hypothetical protein [Pseudomonadota bacterium]MCP4918001.1 hypothetical protein [Pseudomonadota bacterium]